MTNQPFAWYSFSSQYNSVSVEKQGFFRALRLKFVKLVMLPFVQYNDGQVVKTLTRKNLQQCDLRRILCGKIPLYYPLRAI